AVEVGKAVGQIMGVAALISLAVLGAVAALTGLGALAVAAPVIVPLMLIGAAALLLLTPAIIALAGAVIYLSKWVMDKMGLDSKKVIEAGKAVGEVMKTAGLISLYILGAAAALTGLGALAIFAPILIPLMLLGAAALLILTPAMI